MESQAASRPDLAGAISQLDLAGARSARSSRLGRQGSDDSLQSTQASGRHEAGASTAELEGSSALGAALGSAFRRVDASSAETVRVLEAVTKQATHLVGGTTAGLVGMASAMLGNVGTLASNITLDEQFQERQQLMQQQHPKTTRQGVRMGLRAIADAATSASTDVVLQPWEGARTGGAVGLLRGLYRSLTGLVVKPLAATAVLGAKTAEGLASDLMRATHARGLDQYVRMRQPRELGAPGARILPYPRRHVDWSREA